jgi:hypothetical protein
LSLDGSYTGFAFSDGFGIPNSGPIAELIGGPGHYPWAIAISTHEGRMIASGMANFNPVILRIKQPGDPVVDRGTGINWNGTAWYNGFGIHAWGTANGFPREVRPAFWSIWGVHGNPWTGGGGPERTSHEELWDTYPTDAALGAYIQAGMGGTVPRPEIVGDQLRDYLYWVRRLTLRGSLGPTPYQAGPDDPNNAPAMILTLSAVRNSPTRITVSWTTDIPTLGMAAAWAPGQWALDAPPSLHSTLESSFGTTHSKTVTVLPGVTPVHYTVVVETQAGVFSYAIPQTVESFSVSPDGSSITGGTGSLTTAYGTWTFGAEFAPTPQYGGAPFYRVHLNGKPCYGWGDTITGAQELRVANGGNLYAKTFDQWWFSWSEYYWLFNDSPDLVPRPVAALPTVYTTHTPSLDGTEILDGAGSVTSVDGVWTFGELQSDGKWFPHLNGVRTVVDKYTVDKIQINAKGQAFLHIGGGVGWVIWQGFAYNTSTGPTVGPVPIDVKFNPSFGVPLKSLPVGTIVTTVSVTMISLSS